MPRPPYSRAMQSQRANYADRIEKVVQHLSRAIPSGEIPQLAELARIANLSDYHFHRIFRLMTGETPIAMVRRLRLAAAAHSMSAASTVTEAAAAAGYSTSQGFARAFRSGVGNSASGARAGGQLASIKEQLSRPAKPGDAAHRPSPSKSSRSNRSRSQRCAMLATMRSSIWVTRVSSHYLRIRVQSPACSESHTTIRKRRPLPSAASTAA